MRKYINRIKEAEYLHCYQKCFASLRNAKEDYLFHRYNECVSNLYEVLEFFWKALRHLQCHDMLTLDQHMPTRETWDSFMPKVRVLLKHELDELERLFTRYNTNWEKNPADRINARYLHSEFTEQRAKHQLADIEQTLGPILTRAQRRVHLAQPKLSVGILNGYFGLNEQSERPCVEKPWADYEKAGVEGWLAALSENADARLIPMADISPEFNVILNPFGEAYPEIPSATGATPGYQMVKEYLYSGGVFVTAGGNPFYYLFNVLEGKRYDTSKVIPDLPISLRQVPDEQGNIIIEVLTTTLLADTFLHRDFGVGTTMTLQDEHRRDYPVDAFQRSEDQRYWNCQMDLRQLRVFRTLYPRFGGKPMPILRATLSGEEVLPIAFVRYGFGLLFHVGLALNKGSEREFKVATAAVTDGLLGNFEKYFE